MRAYLDTSVVVALLVREPASARAAAVWRGAHTVVSACVLHAEAHAALAAARSVLGPGGVFASGDRRQCAAAHSLGLDVVALQP